jgi:AraC-like DNA-binding protein
MSDASLINIKNRDKKIIENIIYVMESHKLYLTNKLTVKDLASHISNQEYRVRRAINVHMQYRNFSDFINHYRILEAGRRLIGTDTSISNIGLEVGYTSLSVFHKAFKQTYGVTPKEYRIRQQVNFPRGIDTQTA